MIDTEGADPIFIQGILPRSGTNFLWDLLLLHPGCAPAIDPVREDLFLDHSDHLLAFVQAAEAAWDPRWGTFEPQLIRRLYAAIGGGLVSFLWTDRDRRLVTKSPSVHHLKRFFLFFPTARVLVLIRDGRAVTQSCMDTFDWEFERGARSWAEAAREIRRFQDAHAEREDRWRLVRYEDLVENLDGTLPKILRFLELDPAVYDMDAARNLPVRGSSVFLGPGRSSVHWDPVKKDESFSPNQRWRSWTADQLDRFEWIAGNELRALGYGPEPGSPRLGRKSRHRALDAWWGARHIAHIARTGLGRWSRPFRERVRLAR